MSEPGDRVALPPGTRFGDFLIRGLLGAGSFGAVYEATHLPFDRRVALKVLDARYAHHPEALARFDREAEANAVLAHPHIVGVLAVGAVDGSRYLAMECLDGDTLATRITAQAPIAPESLVEWIVPLTSALALVHARGYVHRDLKPGNIFLARRGGVEVPVLLDFGVVQVAAGVGDVRLTRRGALLGSPAYMSPEQARSLPIDGRSDQFALGAVLWECLTGRRLFTGKVVWEVLEAVRNADVAPLRDVRPDLSDALIEVVHRLLAPRPEDRFASMAAAGEALARCATSSGVVPMSPDSEGEPEEPATAPLPAPRDERALERDAAMRRLSSTALRRYRLDAVLGVGGVAAVYAAADLHGGAPVAVKILHAALARDRTASARFLRESRVTRTFAHPAIPRWIAADTDPHHGQMIVMELADGVDLATAIDQGGPLPLPTALRLAARAADALEHAHAAGVLHRDVKPENLVLVGGVAAPDALRLVDFGLAFCIDATRLTLMQTIEGSACYLAPEQVEHGAVTPATDVYALGATLFTMLTGSAPFEGQYLEQLAASVRQPAPSLRARRGDVPEVVDRFVRAMLEKDPRRRPGSAAAVARRLAEMADWFEPAGGGAPAAPAVEAPADLIDEIQRVGERLRQAREGAAASHATIVEQLVEFTSRRLHREALRREVEATPAHAPARPALEAKLIALGDAARDAPRESALESALERMEAQSRRDQGRLLAQLSDLEGRLRALR